jgi:molybdopterin converting factor small subunit
MNVRILAFAGVRELIGSASRTLEIPDDASAGDAWDALAREVPKLKEIERSIRLARNGALVERDVRLKNGDELAVMPPFGGG